MRLRRIARRAAAWLLVGLLICCGAGVSEDPLDRSRVTPGSGGQGSRRATGAACGDSGECASQVCQLDVERNPRCCSADCGASGRVCSTRGECVCPRQAREVEGSCRLVEGQLCRESRECASNFCVDGLCCDDPCQGVCERCDAPERAGSCVVHEEDLTCTDRPGFTCTTRNRCRLPLGLTCGTDADCESDSCEPAVGQTICCETTCNGVCQRCGPRGACDAYPATDDACARVECDAPTRCLAYQTPSLHECSGNGQCRGCEPIVTPAGTPCGAGEQCDGQGDCIFTGVGSVAAGAVHTCAIRVNGNVVCWGSNAQGQLGAAFDRPRVGDDEVVALVTNLELELGRDVVQLTAGRAHTCALLSDGNVRCWGRVLDLPGLGTVDGLLGTDQIVLDEASGLVDPVQTGNVKLPLGAVAVQISAAAFGAHTCALLDSGDVVCWGFNREGQCGNGGTAEVRVGPNQELPRVELGGAKAREVRAAAGHTCVVLVDGGVMCWGEGELGRLGYAEQSDRLRPVGRVDLGGSAVAIATGSGHTCAILEGGTLRCWGSNADGQLGYGHTENIGDDETPARAASLPGPVGNEALGGDVPVGGRAVQITPLVDSRAMCALLASGSVRCWGQNNRGQLGYGHTETLGTERTPTELSIYPALGGRTAGGDLALGAPALALADNGRCAVLADRTLYCWGQNEEAQLGLPAQFPMGSETQTPVDIGPVRWEPELGEAFDPAQ